MEARLPEILRQYRRKHRLSQQQLAEKLNTDQSYISRIETGDRASKASDLDFLKRVSDCLSIHPNKLGLLADRAAPLQNGVPAENFEAWDSIVELADGLRSRGDPETAIEHLSPIVPALEYHNHLEPSASTTELLVRTKLTLGTALGDCLPPERLGESIRHLTEANNSLGAKDRNLKVQVLRAYGNELRKIGQGKSALASLHQAKALLPTPLINGPLAIAIARAEADMQNWPEFRVAISDARRALDKQNGSQPLFNDLVVHEVLLRGLLAQADFRGVARELATPVTEPLNLAPQWRVIHAVTMAEALLFTGELSQGSKAAKQALAAAKELCLPQQVERLRNILFRFRKS